MDEEIWNEFNENWEQLAFESEEVIAKFKNEPIEKTTEIDLDNLPVGLERERLVKTRVNQSFFRSTILTSYNQKCCITGLSVPELLIASHIKPWSKDEQNRTNPQNGLCLNALHDKAFDKGYLTITTDYKVKISTYFGDFDGTDVNNYLFTHYNNLKISLPEKFLPKREFLEYHQKNIFKS